MRGIPHFARTAKSSGGPSKRLSSSAQSKDLRFAVLNQFTKQTLDPKIALFSLLGVKVEPHLRYHSIAQRARLFSKEY